MSTKEAYKQKIVAEVELTQNILAELKAHTENSTAEARNRYAGLVDDLEKKVNATNAKLKELSETGDDAWEHLKDGVESAWSELSAAVRETAVKF